MAQPRKPTRKKLKANKVKYDGRLGNALKLWIINVLLSFVTLGVYYFWGITKLRQYFAGSLTLSGDRFEWHGTGKEMFVGFLKIILILFAFSVFVAFLENSMEKITLAIEKFYYIITDNYNGIPYDEIPEWLSLLDVIVVWFLQMMMLLPTVIAIYYLYSAAKFMAIRYRLARTSWRGIHGHLQGSPLDYAQFAFKRTFYNIISLGYLKPYSDIFVHKYIVNHASFGDINLKFNTAGVDWRKLRTRNIFGLMGPIIGFICFAMTLLLSIVGFDNSIIAFSLMLFGTLVVIPAPIFFIMYKTELLRSKIRGLTAKSFRFKLKITAWELYKFLAINYLILVITFGLGKPLVAHRKLQFISRYLVIGGDLESAEIQQAKKYEPGLAEGLDDVLGLDSGLV